MVRDLLVSTNLVPLLSNTKTPKLVPGVLARKAPCPMVCTATVAPAAPRLELWSATTLVLQVDKKGINQIWGWK